LTRTVLLPWERLLWSGRSRLAPWTRYDITDFRIVCRRGRRIDELALHDVANVVRTRTRFDRLLGTSTLIVHERHDDRPPLLLRGIARGEQAATLLALLTADESAAVDPAALGAALSWSPAPMPPGLFEAGLALLLIAVATAAVIAGRGHSQPVPYASDDPIMPDGLKRSRGDIVRFMEQTVMPWARVTFAPLKGGADRITCATCHGADGERRGWAMPAVAALPAPDVKSGGWEIYSGAMDAQMRNAIYGYGAESAKQKKATLMREQVMPGMARLLHRPPYDFTRSYDYNRSHNAFGCYHCHKVR